VKELSNLARKQVFLLSFPGIVQLNAIRIGVVKDNLAESVRDHFLDNWGWVGVFNHPKLFYEMGKFRRGVSSKKLHYSLLLSSYKHLQTFIIRLIGVGCRIFGVIINPNIMKDGFSEERDLPNARSVIEQLCERFVPPCARIYFKTTATSRGPVCSGDRTSRAFIATGGF
jgi:hypothetical protein